MKPGSQQVLFNFPGRLSCKRRPKPVHVVICALVAMKNVGVSSVELSFHPTRSVLLNPNCRHELLRMQSWTGIAKKAPPKMALCCSVIMDCWNDSVLYNNSYKQYLSQKQTLCGKVVSEVLKQK